LYHSFIPLNDGQVKYCTTASVALINVKVIFYKKAFKLGFVGVKDSCEEGRKSGMAALVWLNFLRGGCLDGVI
jgi:hypothetical protein